MNRNVDVLALRAAHLNTAAGSPALAHATENGIASIRVLTSPSEVESLRVTWSSWPGHRESDVDVFLETIRSQPTTVRPHVLAITRDGAVDAILVARIELRQIRFRLGYARIGGIRARSITVSQGGLRGNQSAENADLFVRQILLSLRSGEADAAVFNQLETGSVLHRSALGLPGWFERDHCIVGDRRYLMSLSKSPKDLFGGLSGSHRKAMRRVGEKLQEAFPGQVEMLCFTRPHELEAALESIEAVARTTYQRGLGAGFIATSYLHRRLLVFAEHGWLRVYVLRLGGQPAAFWIGTVYDGSFCSDYAAHDPAFRHHSPGNYLLARMLEDLHGGGVTEIDLGYGDLLYKQRFATSCRQESSPGIFAARPKGLALNLLHSLATVGGGIAQRLLKVSGLLRMVRNGWRARVLRQLPPTTPHG